METCGSKNCAPDAAITMSASAIQWNPLPEQMPFTGDDRLDDLFATTKCRSNFTDSPVALHTDTVARDLAHVDARLECVLTGVHDDALIAGGVRHAPEPSRMCVHRACCAGRLLMVQPTAPRRSRMRCRARDSHVSPRTAPRCTLPRVGFAGQTEDALAENVLFTSVASLDGLARCAACRIGRVSSVHAARRAEHLGREQPLRWSGAWCTLPMEPGPAGARPPAAPLVGPVGCAPPEPQQLLAPHGVTAPAPRQVDDVVDAAPPHPRLPTLPATIWRSPAASCRTRRCRPRP